MAGVADDIRGLRDSLAQLTAGQQSLNARLAAHMVAEEDSMKLMHAEIQTVGELVRSNHGEIRLILESMPEDDFGKKDLFGHKLDHLDQRERRASDKETRRGIRKTIIDVMVKGAIGLTVFVFLGEKFAKYFIGS
jgi:hypothetical protein